MLPNMFTPVRVRFAPSPTGPIHLGGIRTALYNYLFAKKNGGRFILRMEDTDQKRYIRNAESHILESLKWCGIVPDEGIGFGGPFSPYYQSKRGYIYRFYLNQLLQNGYAYYAFDLDQDLDQKRTDFQKHGIFFSYNYKTRMNFNNSLTMTKKKLAIKLKDQNPYVVRFKMNPGEQLKIHDIIRGNIEMNTNYLDDKILLKSNGTATYHLANTIDDHLMKITHVIRGEEWISSMFFHILLYRSFGWNPPYFAHLPLILKKNGKGKMSKRNYEETIDPIFPIKWMDPNTKKMIPGYRELGYLPESFINMLALLGWNPGGNQEIFSLKELEQSFSLEKIQKSGVLFNMKKMVWFNRRYLNRNKEKVFTFLCKELKKRSIFHRYKKNYLYRVIDLTIDRIHFIHEIWDHSFYFFIDPYYYDQQYLLYNHEKYQYFLHQLEKLHNLLFSVTPFTLDNLKIVFQDKVDKNMWKIYMKLMRLSLVGVFKGVDIMIILEMIGKKQSMNRIKKLINEINTKTI
ncbi:glutamate--tRNA ligase [Blattabacterium cuenoti]|uniref:glutamate--tRNA ligase n=1 Tax=Blattabacterium cuenoti TaxID=1653831 RepID=UPI001EEA6C39|nr:glutamate--tRNA ligase [Blattabacterium cuenoti]